MKKGEVIDYLRCYCHKKMDYFLGKEIVSRLFITRVTKDNYILQNKYLAKFDLLSVKNFIHFILSESKFNEYIETNLSQIYIELCKDNNINISKNDWLYQNFLALESWAMKSISDIQNYNRDVFEDQLQKSINLCTEEFKILLYNSDTQAKLFNDEQINKLKEIASDNHQDKQETIRLLNKAIAIKLSSLDFDNMSYYLFKKLNNQQLEIQTYDQLTDFELYNCL